MSFADVGEMCMCLCRMRPGLAMSQDGLNWARIEGEHHTGALLDVGAEGDWDELFIANPQAGGFPSCLVLRMLPHGMYSVCFCSAAAAMVLSSAVSLLCGSRWYFSVLGYTCEEASKAWSAKVVVMHLSLATQHSVHKQSPCYIMK